MTQRSGMFTKGPGLAHVADPDDGYGAARYRVSGQEYVLAVILGDVAELNSEANAALVAAAFTAATTAEDMGYDGQAAVEALPELLRALDEIASGALWGGPAKDHVRFIRLLADKSLAACRSKESTP